MKTKKCNCNDQYKALGFGEARTWHCPQHGMITVDRRIISQPIPVPVAPIQPTLYPNPYPWSPWTEPYRTVCGNVTSAVSAFVN